ncbi:MAG: hypothetical protein ACREX3_04955 [Gammaproteobacteria bacterium]
MDVARLGADRSVLAIRRGPALVTIRTWRKLTTDVLRERVVDELRQFRFRPSRPANERDFRLHHYYGEIKPMIASTVPGRGWLVVDEVRLGAGVLDGLRELGYQVAAFNGGRRARADRRVRELALGIILEIARPPGRGRDRDSGGRGSPYRTFLRWAGLLTGRIGSR